MRDIAMELAIIDRLNKRNKVSKARIRYVRNLGSEPVIVTKLSLKAPQGQGESKNNTAR